MPLIQSDDVIFPELKKIENFDDSFAVKRQITYGIKKANKYLKKITKRVGITKKLTMHIARHTFASMSGDKIPLQILQRLYRHSDITTTIGYQNSFINKELDDALESVISR